MPSPPKDQPLWTPTHPGHTSIDRYRQHVNRRFSLHLRTSRDLHSWSVQQAQDFWIDLYTYLDLRPPLPPDVAVAYDDKLPMSAIPPFFPGLHRFNYAENALFANPDPNAVALVGWREGLDLCHDEGEVVRWSEFRERVRVVASALRRGLGVRKGDRVAALVATSVWAVVLFHACAAVGAVFTCISPELGEEGVLARLRQVEAKVLFVDGWTRWKGKVEGTGGKVRRVLERLRPRPRAFVIPVGEEQVGWWEESKERGGLPLISPIADFLALASIRDALVFESTSFNDPLMICYTSGTTGQPKCIVHRHGIILQLKKISAVHNATTPRDVVLQYSSTSWVVFYIMCGYFACGAKTIVYNGSPLYPDPRFLLRLVEKFRVTYFGTSPRYLLEVEMAGGISPREALNLSSLRIVYTTGATLSPAQYRWFYHTAFPPHVHLCNTAGGTDTATSLIAADPSAPLYAGEMQIYGLGMDVDIADPETGESIAGSGQAGEMVVRKAFPSMPCFFWGDEGGRKYWEAYFERFAEKGLDVWAQHDWVSMNPITGGLVMHGRSDGVLSTSYILLSSSPPHPLGFSSPISFLHRSICPRLLSEAICFLPPSSPLSPCFSLHTYRKPHQRSLRHSLWQQRNLLLDRSPALHRLYHQHPLHRSPPPARRGRRCLPFHRHETSTPLYAYPPQRH